MGGGGIGVHVKFFLRSTFQTIWRIYFSGYFDLIYTLRNKIQIKCTVKMTLIDLSASQLYIEYNDIKYLTFPCLIIKLINFP